MPSRRTRSRAAGASAPQRPPPAAGLTMAKKRAFTGAPASGACVAPRSKRHHGLAANSFANLLGELCALHFHGGGAGKIRVPGDVAADAFVRQETAVVFGKLLDDFLRNWRRGFGVDN